MSRDANEQTSSSIVALGMDLFFDRQLSSDQSVSCADCHKPEYGWSSPTRIAVGVVGRTGRRHVPTLYNVGQQRSFFWDGRASTLIEQVLVPIEDELEMNLPVGDLIQRLSESDEYRERFLRAGISIDADGIAQALAAFCRTITAEDAPFDRYRNGEMTAMSPAAQRGHDLFFFRLSCGTCHVGPHLTDSKFHNTGIGMDSPEPDLGRYVVTLREEDRGAFKTPSLRNVARTAPYMHDGRFETLEEVVDFYADGGLMNPHLDPMINLLPIDDRQRADLVTFLREGLTSERDPATEAAQEAGYLPE